MLSPMRSPLLEDLTEDERQRLLQLARRRTFARGEVVFHRNDPADTLHLISKGRFVIRVTTPYGHTAALAVLGPGDAFGEIALLGEHALRSTTVAALEPGETRALHKLDFDALIARYPTVSRVLVNILSARVRALSDQLVDAMYVPAELRVLRRLVDVLRLYVADGEEGTVPLTQEELAELAGTSRATANRVLREAEERGEVRLQRGRIAVLAPEELRRRWRTGSAGF